jgi:hypothetical protein
MTNRTCRAMWFIFFVLPLMFFFTNHAVRRVAFFFWPSTTTSDTVYPPPPSSASSTGCVEGAAHAHTHTACTGADKQTTRRGQAAG